MNLDITPEEVGLDPCPSAGEGCHGWMYKATHRLVASGYQDAEIESWIGAYLARPEQPREVANTLAKVRGELNGSIPTRQTVGARRPKDEAAYAELLKDGPTSVDDFTATSPVTVNVSAHEVLTALFPEQRTILFTDQRSQGQLVWSGTTPAEDVDRLGRTNSEGAWFLLNPVTGKAEVRDGRPTRRSEVNMTAYSHVMVEADNVPLEEWLTVLRGLSLPIVTVTLSGNSSAHAIIRVAAKDRDEWIAAAKQIADVVVPLGADPNAITAVRLTRLPGVVRKDNGKEQKLIYFNPDAEKLEVTKEVTKEAEETDTEEVENPSIPMRESERFDDIYYDGHAYFMRSAENHWCYEMTGVMTSVLKTRGCSDKVPKGATASALDIAKDQLRRERRVHGAGPRLFSKHETWNEGGRKFLNTATIRVIEAHPTAGAWGEHFPRYASVLDSVFTLDDYRMIFLAWFKRFYESAANGDLKLGQAMILCGPVHCFKTFLIEKLLAPAMGGYADLSSIVSGEGNGFNAELFHSPLAIIDDSKASESEAQLNRYASAIKKLAAHGRHKYHEKFVTPILVEWKGRVVIAANDDAVSIKTIPSLNISNEDKLIVLAMQSWEDQPGPEHYADVETEIPHLLAWLLDWDVPEKYNDPVSRYGIRSVIASEIRDKIEASGRPAELRDTLNAWWKRRPIEDRGKAWEGTAVDLHQSFNDIFDNSSLVREWPVRVLGRRLAELATNANSGVTVAAKRHGNLKVIKWRIEPLPPETTEPESNDPF